MPRADALPSRALGNALKRLTTPVLLFQRILRLRQPAMFITRSMGLPEPRWNIITAKFWQDWDLAVGASRGPSASTLACGLLTK